ncbi:MAG: N-acetylneuraminate synthase [Leptospira sp.]|nr:N-acetylneuraminate synthase [Leptospira sp.]
MKFDKVLIIAEAGVNHNGDLNLAKSMIDIAAEAGADVVKFQTFKAENIVTKSALKAEYQIKNTGSDDSQFAMLKNLEISFEDHKVLIEHCKLRNIKFLSTGFDLESLNFLNTLNFPFFKIPSGEITNYPYLEKISEFNKPVILSTGMSNMEEIHSAIEVLISKGLKKADLVVLHCNTDYPTPFSDVNLRAMKTIAEKFSVKIGYSDHTPGIEISLAAVALGAVVIEKHFTLDKEMTGPDHKASLDPNELKSLVKGIRNIESALGSSIKQASQSEMKNIPIVRKSIVAAKNIKKGEKFTETNLTTKRPASGINPMMWPEVIGQISLRDYEVDDFIEL